MPSSDGPPGTESLLEIGRVLRPRGLRGELKVRLHWAESDVLSRVQQVWVRRSGGEAVVLRVRLVHPGSRWIGLQLDGVDDVTAAESLRDALIMVDRADLPPLAPGDYYLADLPGAAVVGPEGFIGEVVAVREYPSVDAVVLRTPEGRELEQPLLDDFLAEVDAGGKRIVLRSCDGLIESG